MNRFLVIVVFVFCVAISAAVPAWAVDRSPRFGVWQAMRERLKKIAPETSIASKQLTDAELLGPGPSLEALRHIAQFIDTLIYRPIVPDAAMKYFCFGLQQYAVQWSMPIPKDKLPLQYQPLSPGEYKYQSPLVLVIPREHQEICAAKMNEWYGRASHDRELGTLWYSFGRGCTKASCPTDNHRDRAQVMKYLLYYLDRRLWPAPTDTTGVQR